MSLFEIIAALFGLVSVWLTVKENIWCWATGLVTVFMYIFIFYEARLYSDMILQIIYVFLQIYGWYYWLHGGKEREETPRQPHYSVGSNNLGWGGANWGEG